MKCRPLVLLGALVIGTAMPALSETLVVGTCRTARTHYTTIQSAVSAAHPNDTVLVCPGTYPEQVVITVPLTLKGVSIPPLNSPTIVVPAAGMNISPPSTATGPVYAMIAVDTDGAPGPVDIQGIALVPDLTISSVPQEGIDLVGILYVSTNGTISNSAVRNAGGEGTAIWIENDSGSPITTKVKNNVVDSLRLFNGIVVKASSSASDFDFQITGNVVSAVHYPLILSSNGARGKVSGNTVRPIAGLGIQVNDGSTVRHNNVVDDEESTTALVVRGNATITDNTIFLNAAGDESHAGIGVSGAAIVTSNTIVGALGASLSTTGIVDVNSAATVESNVIGNVRYGINACGSPIPRENIIFDTTNGIVGPAAAGTENTFFDVTTPLTACP